MSSYTEYHKIQSVFLRNPETNYKTFLEGQYAEPEFEYLANNRWEWTEKVDGTNIRVSYWPTPEPDDVFGVMLGGRTEAAQMPVFLTDRLRELFPTSNLATAFPYTDDDKKPAQVVLYGEGYGAKIQKGGGLYMPDGTGCDFILFDVRVGDVWLTCDSVTDIARKLGIKRVPVLGNGTLAEAIEFVKVGYDSYVDGAKCKAEGLVMRPLVELRTRLGHRVITKVKAKDFDNGR